MGNSSSRLIKVPQVPQVAQVPQVPQVAQSETLAQKRYRVVIRLCNKGPIESSDLIGTDLEDTPLENIDRNYLIGLLSAQLIVIDSYEYKSLLDFCFSKGFSLDSERWREVFFKALPKETPVMERLEFEADFYRSHIIVHPGDSLCIAKLAEYIAKGVSIDVEGFSNELQKALCEQVLFINPNHKQALYYLNSCTLISSPQKKIDPTVSFILDHARPPLGESFERPKKPSIG